MELSQFQSLTGSIHTGQKRVISSSFNRVSIPHRYDSHTLSPLLTKILKKTFQSLTGTIHTISCLSVSFKLNVFQSLTGTIHTFDFV